MEEKILLIVKEVRFEMKVKESTGLKAGDRAQDKVKGLKTNGGHTPFL